jgi:hypothetical protein
MAKSRKGPYVRIALLIAALILVVLAMSILDRVAQRGEESTAPGTGDDAPAGANAARDSEPSTVAGVGATTAAAESQDATGAAAGGPKASEDGVTQAADGADDLFAAIAIPADLAEWFEHNEDAAAFHSKLEHEPEDPLWAARLEDFFGDHINSTLDPSKYRVLSLECRSQSCEILAMGYGDDALRGWMTSFSQLFESEDDLKAIVGGPGRASCGGGDLAPGMTALNCTFARAEPAPADTGPPETFRLDAPYAEGVTVDRVNVPDSVASAIESNRELYDLHRRLEGEQTDFGWSNYLEPQIRNYLEDLPSANSLTVLDVVCRTTLCEVQLLVHEEGAFVDFISSMVDFQRLGWHDLTTASVNGTDSEEDEPEGIVWILERGQND